MAAAANCSINALQDLLEKGANVNTPSYNGFMALIYSTKKGRMETVELVEQVGERK